MFIMFPGVFPGMIRPGGFAPNVDAPATGIAGISGPT